MNDAHNPGSPDAVKAGCKCAIGDNGNGAGYMGQAGVFWINGDCPMHAAQPGTLEDDTCNRNGCEGVIELIPVENCSCHINPPCGACEGQQARCPKCDWSTADE